MELRLRKICLVRDLATRAKIKFPFCFSSFSPMVHPATLFQAPLRNLVALVISASDSDGKGKLKAHLLILKYH